MFDVVYYTVFAIIDIITQDPHPLLLLLKDSGILIMTFVIALLHAQEWTPVMMLGSRHNSA